MDVVKLDLHVLLEKEDDLFTAHCLEFDIVTFGESLSEAKEAIKDAVFKHIAFNLDKGTKLFNPAESEYWEKFFMVAGTSSIEPLPMRKPMQRRIRDSRPALGNLEYACV